MSHHHHTHGCTICHTRLVCTAAYVDNPDGIPERYCSALDPDQETTYVCDDCRDHGLCDSGQSANCTRIGTSHLDVDYLTEGLWLCAACRSWEIAANAARYQPQSRSEWESRR